MQRCQVSLSLLLFCCTPCTPFNNLQAACYGLLLIETPPLCGPGVFFLGVAHFSASTHRTPKGLTVGKSAYVEDGKRSARGARKQQDTLGRAGMKRAETRSSNKQQTKKNLPSKIVCAESQLKIVCGLCDGHITPPTGLPGRYRLSALLQCVVMP